MFYKSISRLSDLKIERNDGSRIKSPFFSCFLSTDLISGPYGGVRVVLGANDKIDYFKVKREQGPESDKSPL